MALRKIGKCLGIFRSYVEECDLFAPNILLRFRGDTQFKTLTSALVSIFLVAFFMIVFSNRFMMTINKTDVYLQTAFIEQMDPTLYTINTSEFMFVIGVGGVNLNPDSSGNYTKYFNVGANSLSFLDQAPTEVQIPLQPCTVDQWSKFGDQFARRYSALELDKCLCPKDNQIIKLSGKYSSKEFQLMKVYANRCVGTGCATDTEMQAFFQTQRNFKLQFYFTKTVVNPQDHQPISVTLQDSVYNQFNTMLGSTSNVFMEGFTIETDQSLWPSQDMKTISGITTTNTPEMRYHTLNSTDFEYSTIYLRKSPRERTIKRTYQKYDDLLSYIGGLFGLITILLGLPLYYYNLCCYELSLATNMFTYKKMGDDDEDIVNPSVNSSTQALASKKIQRKDTIVRKKQQEQQLMHSVGRFNFLRFLGFLPYYMIKYLDCAKWTWDVFQPYYEAITQIRKHIDIGKILQRFTYIDRMSKSLLDEDQRNLLHIYSKQNICQVHKDRMRYKIQSHALRLKRDENPSPMPKNILQRLQKLQKTQDPAQKQKRKAILFKLANSYKKLDQRNDEVSRRIIINIDPQFINLINEALKIQIIPPQAAVDMEDMNLQIKSQVDSARLRRLHRASSYSDKVHYDIEMADHPKMQNTVEALQAPRLAPLNLKKCHSYDNT